MTTVSSLSGALTHDHVGISLAPERLGATIEWYESKLEFTVIHQFDVHGTTFTFIANGDVKIELIGATAAARDVEPVDDLFATLGTERVHHFCLSVPDLDATLSLLASKGVTPIGGPMEVEQIAQRIAFITDNLGNIIELTGPRSHERN